MSMKIKVAIVGCGYWGTNIVATLSKINSVQVNVYDSDLEKTKLISRRFPKIKIINSFKEILNDKKIKGVIIATNPTTHFEISKKIISAGKHLFIEKPLTNNSRHIKKLINLSKIYNTKIMSGYIYHYNPYIEFINKTLKRKSLGEIKFLEFSRNNLGPIRTDISCIWDLASHDISTTLLLLEGTPKIIDVTKYNILSKKIQIQPA